MCLAVPGKVVQWLEAEPPFRRASVQFGQVRREVSMECVPAARTGDYVLVHAGIAISTVDPEEARRMLELLEELAQEGLEPSDEPDPSPPAGTGEAPARESDEVRG